MYRLAPIQLDGISRKVMSVPSLFLVKDMSDGADGLRLLYVMVRPLDTLPCLLMANRYILPLAVVGMARLDVAMVFSSRP